MPNAVITDAIVSMMRAMLTVIDAVLGGVVDLDAVDPLTDIGLFNIEAMAGTIVAIVDYIANLIDTIVLTMNL